MKYVPNILSSIRLFLVPVFAFVYFSEVENSHYVALLIFLVAGFTDFLDGYLARRFNLMSKLGAVLDPLADKLMLLTALGCLAFSGAIPLIIFLLFLAKEIFMIVAGTILWHREDQIVIPSKLPGKIATAVSIFAVVMLIINPGNRIFISALILALVLKLTALVTYIKVYKSY